MENGAKNKAILLSLWETTGQYLSQGAAHFLPDYIRTHPAKTEPYKTSL